MINYIRHDEQFYATLKLVTGEEILGEVLVSEDPDTKKDMIFIQNPAKTKIVELNVDEDEKAQKVAMGFIKWMNFSDEDFYVVDDKSVISIAPMSKEAVSLYKRWIKKEFNEGAEPDESQIPINKSMGLIAKVEDARKILERIFKDASHFH